MAAFFKSFDLIRRDINGVIVPLEGETLTIKKVSDNSTIQTVESGSYGYVAAEEIGSSPGDEIKFVHATYPEIFFQTAGTSEANAVSEVSTFIVEDLSENTVEPETAEIWYKDEADLLIPYKRLGSVPLDETGAGTAVFPFESVGAKTLNLFLFSKYQEQFATTEFAKVPSFELGISSRGIDFETGANTVIREGILKGRSYADFYDDSGNDEGLATELYVAEIAADILANNGDKIIAEFSGITAANSNVKDFSVQFGTGLTVFNISDAYNDIHWHIRIIIIRESSSSYKATTIFVIGDNMPPQYTRHTGINYTIPVQLILSAESADEDDVIAKMGYVEYKAAASGQITYNVIHDGDNVIHNGDEVIYTE